MTKLLVTALTFTLLAFVVSGGYHLASNNLKTNGDSYGTLPEIKNAERDTREETDADRSVVTRNADQVTAVPENTVVKADMILKVPEVVDKEDGDLLAGVIVTGYQDVNLVAGDEFTIAPAYDDLSNRIDTNTVLSERFRLIGIRNHTIELERYVIRHKTDPDDDYEAVPEWQEVRVTTKACFDAVTTMLDVSYQLCLDTSATGDGRPILTYEFIGRGTMPDNPEPND